MPKTRAQKEVELKGLREAFGTSGTLVLGEFSGLTVKEMQEFKRKAKAVGVRLMVVKNTLLEMAAKESGVENLRAKKSGKMLLLAVGADPIAAPKLVHQLSQSSNKIQLFAGVAGGRVMELETVRQLAQIPSREELYARMVGSVNAPIAGLVRSLISVMRNFIFVIRAMNKSRSVGFKA